MRVSTSAVYTNFIYNQQKSLTNLLKVNNQISSGVKINFGHEDTTIYQDTLRLINEREQLVQISDSVKKARTYSDNTDVALQQIKRSLDTFKVKLVQAANDVHSVTSYKALANDLESLMFNIRDVANTSINGNFLFSGTNMKQQPFDKDGNYLGNNQSIYAQAGDRLEIPYNTDGYTLMHGMDITYSKRVTTNMPLWNQTILHHRVMDKEDPYGVDTQKPIMGTDTIRDLIGQPDDSVPTYFYLRGKRPDGEAFKARIEMTNGATVYDLMDKIGREMGNTNIFKAVDVTLSHFGHIEIKDVKSGRMLTDFHMVASDLKTDNINDITTTQNAHIYEFNKSGYAFVRTSDSLATRQNTFEQRLFEFGSTLRTIDKEAKATKFDTVQSVMGKNVDSLSFEINGTTHTMAVNIHTTLNDMTNSLKSALQADLGGTFDVGILDGKLSIFDNNASGPHVPDDQKIPSLLTGVTITANNSGGEKVLAFSQADAVGYDKARFEKAGAVMTATIKQTVRSDSSYATADTQMKDVSASVTLDEKRLHLEILDVNGNRKLVEIKLRDVPNEFGQLSTFQVIEPNMGMEYDIYDHNGNKTTASGYISQINIPYGTGLEIKEEQKKGFTYQQLLNVMSIATSNNLPVDGSFDSYNDALKKSEAMIKSEVDSLGRLKLTDLTTAESKIQISLFDADTDRFDDYVLTTNKSLISSYQGTKAEQGWDLKEIRRDRPLKEVFGFDFTGGLTLSGTSMAGNPATATLNENSTLQELMDAIDNAFGDGVGNGGFIVDVIDGKLIVRDNETTADRTLTDINFLFNDAKIDMQNNRSPAFSFAANNALTIDEAKVNVFAQLQEAIDSVKAGQTRPDGNSEKYARNMGIQNAIYMIDHILDHMNQVHTNNGSIGIALNLTFEKSEMMTLNVKELKSMVLDADIGEAVMKMYQYSIGYQAFLSTINRIHQLSLVNYLK